MNKWCPYRIDLQNWKIFIMNILPIDFYPILVTMGKFLTLGCQGRHHPFRCVSVIYPSVLWPQDQGQDGGPTVDPLRPV